MSVVLTPGGTRGVKLPVSNGVIAAMTRILVGLQRLARGRFKMNGQPLLLLRTVGAKSGEPRTTMLAQFPEPDGSTLIVASFGGTARHPAWYFNLAKHPDQVLIERGGQLIRVRPQSLSGEQREQAWQRIISTAPGFAEYQRKTDRELPVVRLTPIS
jgi:deazaflavin-dependent oxidoreductase (nitroreductase family)